MSTQPGPGDTQPIETAQVDSEPPEATAWGRSSTSWLIMLGILAAVVVNYVVGPIAAAGTLSVLAVAGGVLRLVLPRASGLAARSRAFDATAMLGFGVLIAVFAAVVPQ